MVKRIMMTLVLSALLNVGHSFAMENPNNTNLDTVASIAGIIKEFGFQKNTAETKEIILDALREKNVEATDEEINEAFVKVESEGNQGTQKQKAKKMTPKEKENAYKMMIINEALKSHEDILKKEGEEHKEVQNVIGGKLHDVSANPVLDGELVYEGAPKPFKIKDLVKKDGSIDLSDPIFGDASKYLLITTDPKKFFNIDENSERLVILIAPRFLIEEKIESSAKPFQSIMDDWDSDDAPIGMFWRDENWDNKNFYNYLISENVITISENNLDENWKVASNSRHGRPMGLLRVHHNALQKISCLFLNKN